MKLRGCFMKITETLSQISAGLKSCFITAPVTFLGRIYSLIGSGCAKVRDVAFNCFSAFTSLFRPKTSHNEEQVAIKATQVSEKKEFELSGENYKVLVELVKQQSSSSALVSSGSDEPAIVIFKEQGSENSLSLTRSALKVLLTNLNNMNPELVNELKSLFTANSTDRLYREHRLLQEIQGFQHLSSDSIVSASNPNHRGQSASHLLLRAQRDNVDSQILIPSEASSNLPASRSSDNNQPGPDTMALFFS